MVAAILTRTRSQAKIEVVLRSVVVFFQPNFECAKAFDVDCTRIDHIKTASFGKIAKDSFASLVKDNISTTIRIVLIGVVVAISIKTKLDFDVVPRSQAALVAWFTVNAKLGHFDVLLWARAAIVRALHQTVKKAIVSIFRSDITAHTSEEKKGEGIGDLHYCERVAEMRMADE
jgi:hypothetical protein